MEQDIIDIIAQILNVETEDINLDTSIGDLPEWDSLHHLQIISTLEEKYGIKFQTNDLVELEDVSDLIKLTEELVS